MTISRLNPPLAVDTIDEAEAALRERGMRISTARRLLLSALFVADGPVRAEAIAAGLDGRLPGSDLTSVYRNLEVFEELGLVRHVHLGHGPGLYALATGEKREYVVCDACGRVDAVDRRALDPVREAILAATGFEARFAHFPIVGLCPDCAAKAS